MEYLAILALVILCLVAGASLTYVLLTCQMRRERIRRTREIRRISREAHAAVSGALEVVRRSGPPQSK